MGAPGIGGAAFLGGPGGPGGPGCGGIYILLFICCYIIPWLCGGWGPGIPLFI